MTGRERIIALLNGQRADQLPCMPITMMFAADILGVPYKRYVLDHKIMAEAQIKTAEMFRLDYVSTISDPVREACDYGASLQWYEDQPPAPIEEQALFRHKSTLAERKAPDLPAGGRMEDRIRGVELLRERAGKALFVEGWVEGPCAEAADLRGMNRLMLDFSDDPAFVHDLFDFTLEGAIRFASAQIEAGADIIGVGDAAASLVGPRVYREFVWPWEKKLVDAIHARGGKVRLHICGNTRRILREMGQLESDMMDVDYPVPLEQARTDAGPRQVLAGNLDPMRVVRNSSPAAIQQSLQALHLQVGEPWIVAAGCEIVRDTPHQNLHAMVEFAHTRATCPDLN